MDANAETFFNELYQENCKAMYTIAYANTHNANRAEEIIQETFLSAWLEKEKLITHPNPAGWLRIKLHNIIMHSDRSEKRYRIIMEKLAQLYGDRSEHNGSDGDISFVKDMVTEHEYKLLKSVYEDGYTKLETAKRYGMSYDACIKAIQRASEKIKQKLG